MTLTPEEQSWLAEVEERVGKATEGPGSILHTAPMDDALAENIIESIRESIASSRKHRDGLPWWWIEIDTADGRPGNGIKVAEFGCGPTSEANALFYGAARTDITRLLALVKRLVKENGELKEPAAFGWQCYQDRCEGAYVEASVLKAVERERDTLRSQLEKARSKLKTLTVKIQTISVRANCYGPDFPPTYADALWTLARESEAALAAIEGEGK